MHRVVLGVVRAVLHSAGLAKREDDATWLNIQSGECRFFDFSIVPAERMKLNCIIF